MKIKCSCGKEVELVEDYLQYGQINRRFVNFCECGKKWVLSDMTEEYEEQIINDVLPPENGEYQDDDGYWHRKNGSDME